MNCTPDANRGKGRVSALAAGLAAAALATACGGAAPATGRLASAGSVTIAQELALAQCMRGHGAPNFPDPGSSGGFRLTTTPNGPKGTIDIDSGQIQAAYGACRHLLAGGGPDLAQLRQRLRQQQQQALPALVKFAHCMRRHGVPDFPDPPPAGAQPTPLADVGINPRSPRFQAAVHACQQVLPAGMHISIKTNASTGKAAGSCQSWLLPLCTPPR